MTESDFIRNSLNAGWNEQELHSFVEEEKLYISKAQKANEFYLPLEAALAWHYETLFKARPAFVEAHSA